MNFDADGILYGSGTMYDALVREAGGENVPAVKGVTGWSKVSDEVMAGMRPDWIVMLDDGSGAVRQMARMRDTAVWKQIPAVREGRVIFVPEREMSSVSQHSLKAVERLGQAFMTVREGGGR
jgi:ABC-type Fe3+-hydroxamate transport system substrate-binding protein